MPAAFGAWYHMGGHRAPIHDLSAFENESQVQEHARKCKHGKRAGRRELAEKFKALEIVDFDRYASGVPYCDFCLWWQIWCKKPEEEEDEHDDYMFYNEDCRGICQQYTTSSWPWMHTKGVYALNREALAIHDAHRQKGRSSAPHSRRHRSSGQKRSTVKKEARGALRDFESRE